MALNTKHEFLCYLQSNYIQEKISALMVLLWNIFIPSLCLAHQVTMYEDTAAQMSDRGCYILLNNTRGNITVPQPLLKNGNFIQCEWDISPSGPLHIKIHFLHLDLPKRLENNQCFGTFLEYGIFDYFGRRLVIGEECGKLIPKDYIADQNRVWLKYYSIPTNGGSTLPFLVSYEALENSHIRNTTIVISSILSMMVIGVVGCYICYCQRKKRKDPYYNKRRQQKRLQKIKIRSGLVRTPLDWKRVAFKLNENEQVTVKQCDSLGGSCSTSTTITSVATSLKFSSDEPENGRSIRGFSVCEDPTKYEDISDYVGQENPPNDGKQDPACEPTYLSLHLEKSCNGHLPSASRPITVSQLETVEPNYLSFKTFPLSASQMTSRDSIPLETSKSGDSGLANNNMSCTCSLKSAQVDHSPFLLLSSLDFQPVNPLFHSTPDLELTCAKPNMNIPVIRINDELVSSFFMAQVRNRKQSCSAPDLSLKSQRESPGQMSGWATPHPSHQMGDAHYSDPAATDSSNTSQQQRSIARPRPTISPITGVSPGQIHKGFFTPNSEDLKSQSNDTPSPVYSCLFEHKNNAKSKGSDSC